MPARQGVLGVLGPIRVAAAESSTAWSVETVFRGCALGRCSPGYPLPEAS
jgi:hypothetical protein